MVGTIRVVCYAGHRADERPQRFFTKGMVIEIMEILDRWIGEDHRYFKVRGDDLAVYILRHDTRSDSWEITMYDGTGSIQ